MIKFYPYYKSNLQNSKNDLLTWSLVTATIGFGILLLLGFLLEPLVIQKFSQRSKLIVDYYHFIFPFVFGMLFFAVLEGYCWAIHESVFSTFLKENEAAYQVDETSRNISFVAFSAAPTSTDSLNAYNQVASLKEEFKNATDVSSYLNKVGTEKNFENTFLSKNLIQIILNS